MALGVQQKCPGKAARGTKSYSSVAAAKGEIAESWISGRYAGLSPSVDDGSV